METARVTKVTFNHAPDRHWRLSPSGSSRWLACPGSAVEEIESTQNEHTIRGNELHSKAAFFMGAGLPLFGNDPDTEAVRQAIEWTRDFTGELYVEYQMESDSIPDLGGTIDLLFWEPEEKRVSLFDFKFGKTKVVAKDNAQLKTYCVLALERFPAEKFRGAIAQPAVRKSLSVADYTKSEILAHRRAIVEASQSSELIPGNQCFYCPLRHSCPENKYAA